MEKTILVEGDQILLSFPYSAGIIARIKEELVDYKYDKSRKVWTMPATQFHAQKAREFAAAYRFKLDISVSRLANQEPGTKVPETARFKNKLYGYQKDAVSFLMSAEGKALLADEMGLGKTIEALAYLALVECQSLLVVAPTSVLYKWEAEIERWLGWTTQILRTGKEPYRDNVRVHLCSYGIAVSRFNELKHKIFEGMIIDECHNLGNHKSQRTNAIKAIHPTNYLLGLSGTPFLNRPIEMFTMLSLIDPIGFGDRWGYARRYCDLKQTYFGWDMSGHSNESELQERVKHILLRRTKSELKGQLPDLTRSIIYIEPPTKEYDTVLRNDSLSALQTLAKLRHIMGWMKIDSTVELASDILMDPAAKLVVYAHHRDVVQELANKLSAYDVLTVVGEDNKERRSANIEAFQQQTGPRVMIISEAGGEGIDLYRASHIIFCERAWNPGKEEQAEARLHRIGQTNPVTAYYLVARNTLDEQIHTLINQKREVFKNIVITDDTETNIQTDLLKFIRSK